MKNAALASHPQPANSYAEAVERIGALQAKDTAEVHSLCRTRFFTHETKTARAIVFFHGYTNCPQQFHQLGLAFHQRGYNVLIPRLPYNGLADRLTPEHSALTAEMVAAHTDEAADIARGLGDHITLTGLSAGGVMAAWAAQQRADLDLAAPIAPLFGLPIPKRLSVFLGNLSLRLPNLFVWWDRKLKADIPGPHYGYPRFSTRALAQILRLGNSVRAAAKRARPAAGSVLVVTNAADEGVSNQMTAEVVNDWRRAGAQNVRTYEFGAERRLIHDVIDPEQVAQRTDYVYPLLFDLINQS